MINDLMLLIEFSYLLFFGFSAVSVSQLNRNFNSHRAMIGSGGFMWPHSRETWETIFDSIFYLLRRSLRGEFETLEKVFAVKCSQCDFTHSVRFYTYSSSDFRLLPFMISIRAIFT